MKLQRGNIIMKTYLIYREHVFEGGSRKSYNAIAEIREIFKTGIIDADYSNKINFPSRKEAYTYCKDNGYNYITLEKFNKEWSRIRANATSQETAKYMNENFK
jgi:hypothetical protein